MTRLDLPDADLSRLSWSDPVEQGPIYLVRYGLMGHVGRFACDPAAGPWEELIRGRPVVVQTDRGLELGEVLVRPALAWNADRRADEAANSLIRPAGPADLEGARRSESLRAERFADCRRILDECDSPVELIDVEPLLDHDTTVLHIVGGRGLDLALLRARFRDLTAFDVVFESFGEVSAPEPPPVERPAVKAKRCGDCDCSGGGCGSKAARSAPSTEQEAVRKPACATASHSGCASCGIARGRGSHEVREPLISGS